MSEGMNENPFEGSQYAPPSRSILSTIRDLTNRMRGIIGEPVAEKDAPVPVQNYIANLRDVYYDMWQTQKFELHEIRKETVDEEIERYTIIGAKLYRNEDGVGQNAFNRELDFNTGARRIVECRDYTGTMFGKKLDSKTRYNVWKVNTASAAQILRDQLSKKDILNKDANFTCTVDEIGTRVSSEMYFKGSTTPSISETMLGYATVTPPIQYEVDTEFTGKGNKTLKRKIERSRICFTVNEKGEINFSLSN